MSNPTELETFQERARWVFDEFRYAGYSATDTEKPGEIVFPYSPKDGLNLDELTKKETGSWGTTGKFILLDLTIPGERFGEKPLEKNVVRMCFRGSTHLTIARYALQELMQYIQQGFGNVSFTPADILFLQNHHESGMTQLLDRYAYLTVIDGGKIKVLPGKEVELFGHSQTFSNASLVSPEQRGYTGLDDPKLKSTLEEHLQHLRDAANTLRKFYDDFTFRIS